MAGFLAARELEIYPGAQVGAAVMLPVDQRLELRVDLVQRRYWPRDSDALDMWSVGIGFTVRAPTQSSP